MPSFDIVKHSELKDSYRVQSVIGAFDLDVGKLDEHFSGNIDIEGKDWNVGLIPMPMRKDAKRVHRFVVLPDYQGIGIGMSFQSAVCDIVRREGFEGTIWNVTTTPALYKAQIKSDRWKLVRYGHATLSQSGVKKDLMSRMVRNSSRGRITYSFIYVGEEGKERLK